VATGDTPAQYTGQVERDPEGRLWAVLYRAGRVVYSEPVRSLRRGRRRVTDLLLAATDASVWRDLSRRSLLHCVDAGCGQSPEPSTRIQHRPSRSRCRRDLP